MELKYLKSNIVIIVFAFILAVSAYAVFIKEGSAYEKCGNINNSFASITINNCGFGTIKIHEIPIVVKIPFMNIFLDNAKRLTQVGRDTWDEISAKSEKNNAIPQILINGSVKGVKIKQNITLEHHSVGIDWKGRLSSIAPKVRSFLFCMHLNFSADEKNPYSFTAITENGEDFEGKLNKKFEQIKKVKKIKIFTGKGILCIDLSIANNVNFYYKNNKLAFLTFTTIGSLNQPGDEIKYSIKISTEK